MKEFYNKSRVMVHLLDLWEEVNYHQELNFPTFPFSSEKAANEHTRNEIDIWIANEGNHKYDTSLELSYWEAI